MMKTPVTLMSLKTELGSLDRMIAPYVCQYDDVSVRAFDALMRIYILVNEQFEKLLSRNCNTLEEYYASIIYEATHPTR